MEILQLIIGQNGIFETKIKTNSEIQYQNHNTLTYSGKNMKRKQIGLKVMKIILILSMIIWFMIYMNIYLFSSKLDN